MPVTSLTLRDAEHWVTYTNASGGTTTAVRDLTINVYTPQTPGHYPVIVYSHGYGAGSGPNSAAGRTAQSLADQGYIVLVPTHLDSRGTYSDGMVTRYSVFNDESGLHRVADVQFALDQAQILTATQPGYSADTSLSIVAGHSFGAFTAGLIAGLDSEQYGPNSLPPGNRYGITSLTDDRFDAAILLSPQGTDSAWARLGHDAWDGIRIPLLSVTGTRDLEPNLPEGWRTRLDVFGESDFGRTAAVVFRDAQHADIGGDTDIAGLTAAIAGLSDRFIDAWVRGDPVARAVFSDAEALARAIQTPAHAYARPSELGTGVLFGTAGGDTLDGLDSNDVFIGLGGSDRLNGNGGIDTAVYAGLFRGYSAVTTTRVAGGREGGTDTLNSIERIRFLDGTMSFDTGQVVWTPDEATIAVARLYQACLGRVPDISGLEHYRSAVDYGYDLTHFTKAMIESPEFVARFGTLTDQQFVEQIYRFVLGRDGDPPGVATYVAALGQGYTRADVVLVFSESPENKVRYQPTFENVVRRLEDGRYPTGAADDDASVKSDGALVLWGEDDGRLDLPEAADALVAPWDDDLTADPAARDADDALPSFWEAVGAQTLSDPDGSSDLHQTGWHIL